ncbi:thiamine phosphate synthase [Brevibacterium daeguense]|uniref:Thiamine-phosphate synthase n=1 Tax=Brevibacterium daeguense TaxID=909936 RepID=A0ABP8EFY3_9MICO|nr:thiamine phosphate synthase [Brevibacterium daeguense]
MTDTVHGTGSQHPTDRLAGLDTALYLVTDTAQCASAGRSVAQTVAEAVAGGVGIVQVRDKTATDAAFRRLTEEVLEAVERTRQREGITRPIPVFLNDRVEIARDLLAEGTQVHVHVGQTDTPVTKVRELLGPEPLIGLSAAEDEEFAAARASGVVDLLGVGPAYETATKADAPAGLGPQRLAELVARAGLPCVGIGGITADRAAELRGTGIIGICVVSAICAAPDPRAAARALRTAFLHGLPAADESGED